MKQITPGQLIKYLGPPFRAYIKPPKQTFMSLKSEIYY